MKKKKNNVGGVLNCRLPNRGSKPAVSRVCGFVHLIITFLQDVAPRPYVPGGTRHLLTSNSSHILPYGIYIGQACSISAKPNIYVTDNAVTHTHTHTHTYIYIYIYIQRERERENPFKGITYYYKHISVQTMKS